MITKQLFFFYVGKYFNEYLKICYCITTVIIKTLILHNVMKPYNN